MITTYKDIYNEVMKGNIIIIPSSYGNTRTYFKNEEGKARQRFNKCKDSYFNGLDTRIDDLDLKRMKILKPIS